MDTADDSLVRRALEGDRRAFSALVARHRRLLVVFLGRLLGDTAEAEDVAQEACLAAFLGLDRLREPERFSAWLTGIGLNLARMRLRQRRPSVAWEDLDGGRVARGFTWDQASPSAEAVADARRAHAAILTAIRALPDELASAVSQHYLEGLSIAEIAMLADVPAGTVKARLHRARGRLRTQLAPAMLQRPARGAGQPEVVMIEMTVQSVVMRAAHAAESDAIGSRPQRVVLLKDPSGQRMLPIWVGPSEGDIIALLLAEKGPLRPMTYELVMRVLAVGQLKLQRVAITRLDDEIFYATLSIETQGGTHEVDARPSDALAVALRAGAPIYVEDTVLEKAGVGPDEWEANLAADGPADSASGQWKSVAADDILKRWAWPPKPEADQ